MSKAKTPELVSVAEFSRRCKQPRTTIRRWISSGDIKVAADGQVFLDEGLAQVRQLVTDGTVQEEDGAEETGLRAKYITVQIREKKAVAALRELELQHEQGRFVLAEDVQAEGRALGATLRAGLLAIPARASLKLEAIAAAAVRSVAPDAVPPRAPAIEALLLDEINEVLIALQGTRYVR